MSTGAERQRNRRQRLRRQGIVDVTVPVPEARRAELRQFARTLRTGAPAAHAPLLAALQALKAIRPALMEAGVRHAGVFGSAARGDDRPDSDIDIVIDVDARAVGDIVAYVKIAERVKDAVRARCPDAAIDVADRAALKPRVRERVERDAVYAF
jgi:predicted nucleotidyltransferase